MCSTKGETINSNPAGWGTARNKRKIETDSNFLLHQIEHKEIQERHLNDRNNRIVQERANQRKMLFYRDKEKKKAMARLPCQSKPQTGAKIKA